jgi:hypothetical protein
VDVLQHHHVPDHNELVPLTDSLERGFEQAFGFRPGHVGQPVVAAEGKKVHLAGLLVPH